MKYALFSLLVITLVSINSNYGMGGNKKSIEVIYEASLNFQHSDQGKLEAAMEAKNISVIKAIATQSNSRKIKEEAIRWAIVEYPLHGNDIHFITDLFENARPKLKKSFLEECVSIAQWFFDIANSNEARAPERELRGAILEHVKSFLNSHSVPHNLN